MTEHKPATSASGQKHYGQLDTAGVLAIERILPGTPEQIWPYLTEPEKTALWLGSLQADMKSGSQLKITFDHASLSPPEESEPEQQEQIDCSVVTGEILEYEPFKTLRFSWCWDKVLTEVCFQLTPQTPDTSLLIITHAQLTDKTTIISVAAGWHTHVDILLAKLNGETPLPFWGKHDGLITEYQHRFAT